MSDFSRASEASIAAADEIEQLIRDCEKEGRKCVLGLVTGSSPTGIYEELVRRHRENNLSFKHVITFNLDEYFPMHPSELQSVSRFMHEHLFDHIDLPPEQIHGIPDGTIEKVMRQSIVNFTRNPFAMRVVSICRYSG